MSVGDVVQFTGAHRWRGCFGYIDEIEKCGSDEKVLIGVPMPWNGTAYIFSMASAREFEIVGSAVLMPESEEGGR